MAGLGAQCNIKPHNGFEGIHQAQVSLDQDSKDGTIYVGSDDNHLYALNPDGSEKWRFETGEVDDFDCSPAIGEDGTIYFSSKDGHLYALHGESGGLADTPWPMHARDPRRTGRVLGQTAR